MSNRKDILDELNGFPNLIKASNTNPYKVPDGYFSHLSEAVHKEIQKKSTPFTSPGSSYFDGLANQILSKVKQNEEITISANKNNPYSVPTGYFEQLPDAVLAKVKTPAKVISIKRSFTRWMGAAAAAIILLVVGLQYFNSSPEPLNDEALYAALNEVPTEELKEFASLQGFDTTIETLPYLYLNDEEAEVNLDIDIDSSLEEYSTEEIATYLNLI